MSTVLPIRPSYDATHAKIVKSIRAKSGQGAFAIVATESFSDLELFIQKDNKDLPKPRLDNHRLFKSIPLKRKQINKIRSV